MKRFGMMFLSPGKVQSENSDKLEFYDPLNENAVFLKSQELQNEDKMVPKRAEKRKKSREEGKREQRSANSRASWERSGATSFDFRGLLGEGRWSSRLLLTTCRPRVSEGLGPKSEQKCCKVAQIRDIAISWILASQ